MKMKKTLAGVMAGAMAVSAMAATVSADQDAISLTYDLKKYVKDVSVTSSVTVTSTWSASLTGLAYTVTDAVSNEVTGATQGGLAISKDNVSWNNDGTYTIVTPDFVAWEDVSWSDNYLRIPNSSHIDFGVENMLLDGTIGPVNGAYSYIDYKEDDKGNKLAGMTDFQITATPLPDKSNPNGIIQGAPVTISWTGDRKKTDGSHWNSQLNYDAGARNKTFKMPVSKGDATGSFCIANYDLGSLGQTGAAASAKNADKYMGVESGEYGFQSVTAKMTYKVAIQYVVDGTNAWSWTARKAVEALGDTAIIEKKTDAALFNQEIKGMVKTNHMIKQDPVSIAISAFTEGEYKDKIYPMKSSLNAPANVINWLSARKTEGNYYVKPVAVINDAIANHENVTFTFASYDGVVTTAKSHLYQEWVEPDRAYGYRTSSFDWENPTFGQHLYTNTTNWVWDERAQAYVNRNDGSVADTYSLYATDNSYDMYGSYSSAWAVNLFTGAIVVNSGVTMQLNDTDKFDWGANTLTFDWFTITDEGKITDAKTFLTSMLLYTPVDWYWDNLTVVVSDLEDDAAEADDEDVGAGEGAELEDDELDDDDEDEEDIPAIEPEMTTEAPAPVTPAPSPETGNAPVALAVIPVALAAAAVIAKKRG